MAGLLPKPVLRYHLQSNIKRNIVVATLITVAVGVSMKVFYNDVQKQKYAEFYRTYDAEAEFVRMRDLGLFQSCKKPGK